MNSPQPTLLIPHRWRQIAAGIATIGLFAIHAAVIVASLSGPLLVLGQTLSPKLWASVLGDAARWAALLGATAAVVATALVISVLGGTVIAVLLFRTNARFRTAGIALLLLGSATPLQVVSASVLAAIGIERWLGSALVTGVIHGLAYLPISALIIGMAVRSVSADLEEIALVEGAAPFRMLRRVTLRMGLGGIGAAALLVTLWTTTDYSVSDVLIVRTFAEEVYTQYQLHQQEPQAAAIVALPQALLFSILFLTLGRRLLAAEHEAGAVRPLRSIDLHRWRTPFSIIAVGACLLLAAGPVVALACRLTGKKTFLDYASLFRAEIQLTLWTAAAAGVICAALSVGIAWCLVRRHWSRFLAAYLVVMLAMPAPVLGLGIIRLLNRDGLPGSLYDSPFVVVLAYVFRFLPLAVIVVTPFVRAVPTECELAARADGAGPLAILTHVIWPHCLPAAAAAMFIVMILSLGELPCSLLVTPPGYMTVAHRFFTLIHYGLYPDAAALSLISMGTTLIPWLALVLLLRKRALL